MPLVSLLVYVSQISAAIPGETETLSGAEFLQAMCSSYHPTSSIRAPTFKCKQITIMKMSTIPVITSGLAAHGHRMTVL